MLRVNHCCCCFDLKYGYYTYGIVVLIFRVAVATFLYFSPSALIISANQSTHRDYSAVLLTIHAEIGYLLGWCLVTAAVIFVGLKGIVQERSILVFPSIVLIILELIVSLLSTVITAAIVTPWILLYFVFSAAINIYVLICLLSLYYKIKEEEQHRAKGYDHSVLRTV